MPDVPEWAVSTLARKNISPDDAQAQLIANLDPFFVSLTKKKSFFSGLKETNEKRGAYIYGDVGRGKTIIMDAFYEALPDDFPKMRVHFHVFMQHVHDFLHENRATEVKSGDQAIVKFAKQMSKKTKILCFDEFHVTDIADAMILSRLFKGMIDHKMYFIVTSNWRPDTLYKGGLQRKRFLPFIDIIEDKLDIFYLDGDIDYRAQALKDAVTYLTPLNAQTTHKMDNLFRQLTGDKDPEKIALKTKSRMLPIGLMSGKIGRYSFQSLCENPLGARDYGVLASHFETLFIDNIPRLGYDRRNEAKRFMALVDVFYDQGKLLIISAAEKAEDLYSGSDHAFEFERTVSRLNEMSSSQYRSPAQRS